MTSTITVQLGPRSYDVLAGRGLLADPAILRRVAVGPCFLVEDAAVVSPWGDALARSLAGATVHRLTIPGGEASKSLAEFGRLLDAFAAVRLPRDGTVISLGGGVIGDLAGFAAASWHRGVRFVQCPTSLLAMADSSVGGKTGVNLASGKNLVGAFWQPALVVADVECLSTLPAEEFRCGLAEMAKAAIIADPALFAEMERLAAPLSSGDAAGIEALLAQAIRIKADIVGRDEREDGPRRLLNLGHTIGHAIEAGSGYALRHGEAVAIGTVAEARIAAACGLCGGSAALRIEKLFAALALPTRIPPVLSATALLARTRGDKKVAGGRVHWALPLGVGKADVTADVADATVLAVLESLGASR